MPVSGFSTVLLALLLLCGCERSPAAGEKRGASERAAPVAGTRVVMLGSGTPIPEPGRSGPSVAVIAGDSAYLVDCGPGVVRRAAEAYMRGVAQLRIEDLTRAFVTHLHSDHTAGYPDLILTPWVAGRSVPLEVYGPPGIEKMTEHLLQAYEQDILVRTFGREEAAPEGVKVVARDIEPGLVYEDANVRVRAFAVKHGDWPHAYGYRFETGDRTIVISGDTAPCDSLVEYASGCDVLVHEVYSQAGFDYGPPSFQEYHSNFHTSTVELAEIARKVQPKLLVLYHVLFFGASEEELLEEIHRHYEGDVVVGRDLEVY